MMKTVHHRNVRASMSLITNELTRLDEIFIREDIDGVCRVMTVSQSMGGEGDCCQNLCRIVRDLSKVIGRFQVNDFREENYLDHSHAIQTALSIQKGMK